MLITIIIFLIFIDQVTKLHVSVNIPLGTSIPVLPGIFHITHIHNPGAAFGVLAHQQTLFIVFSIILIFCFFWYYQRLKNESLSIKYGACFLFGGALGNFIDRIKYGHVIDFFDFRIWPIFNVADIAICIGVSLLMYAVIFEMKEIEEK